MTGSLLSAETDAGSPVETTRAKLYGSLLLASLCVIAYLPALNNGFISDDYMFLERVEALRQNPFYLFSIPPENFRLTDYAAFWFLKRIFAYHAAGYYLFTISIHLSNCFLLRRCLLRLPGTTRGGANLAAILFAVFQNPQEAVMWICGMHELLLGFCVLLTFLFWLQGKRVWSLLCYCLALFTKESAPVVLPLLFLLEYWRGRLTETFRSCCLFLLPTAVFAILYWRTQSNNSLLAANLYSLRWGAASVLLNSLNRLAFPWLYLAVILAAAAFQTQRRSGGQNLPAGSTLVGPRSAWYGTFLAGATWMAVALAPYLFLTYQNHVPSRHQYLASMAMAWLLSDLLLRIPLAWRRAFVIAFVGFNISYLWLKKDAQYQERAAPTTRLIEILQTRRPESLRVVDFPNEPWIAKLTTRLVPGWDPTMLAVNEPVNSCPACPLLRWDPVQRRYRKPGAE